MNPAEAPTAKTHNLISIIFKIREASLEADFQSKLATALIRMLGNAKTENIFLGEQYSLWRRIVKIKLIGNGLGQE